MKTITTLFIFCLFLSCSSKSDDGTQTENTSASFDLTAVKVTNASGDAPVKGDEITITMTVKNTGSSSGTVAISPKLSSSRFGDYHNVALDAAEGTLQAGETAQLTLTVGPFFKDAIKEKHYALGSGEYFFEAFDLNGTDDKEFEGRIFQVATSNRVLVPVIYDPTYFSKVNYNGSMKTYLEQAFTRKIELYNEGNYTEFEGGLDEMMDIEHLFYTIPTGNVSAYDAEGGLCEKAIALGGDALGLTKDWEGPVGTQGNNHGFDYLMAITPDSFGGVACGWIDVQVTGVFDFDLSIDRSQILIIHETSHLLGSPHCDQYDVEGYVMCGGEKHRKYIDHGIFVYYQRSRDMMSNKFD